jgi:methyl-accepting chemotaxis protein
MNSTMTIGRRFIVTAGVLVLLSSLLASIAIVGFNGVSRDIHIIATNRIPGATYALSIRADVNRMRGDFLQHMHESDQAEMQKLEADIALMNDQLSSDMKSYEDAITVEEDRENFSKLKPELSAINEGWASVLPLSRATKSAEAYALYRTAVQPHVTAVRDQALEIAQWNKKRNDQTVAEPIHTTQSAWWLTLCISIAALVIGIAIAWVMITALNRQMTRAVSELTEGAEQIGSAASQVSASSQSLAQGSSEQAASIEETSASSEEINSMARKNTDNSRSMASLMTQSQGMFVKTNSQLEEMVVSMDEINESSGKISKIIKVIDEIAFQTNILALNAAVEAARAGEAGMGFAVVADEVRNLAQRSAQAAKDTALLIEESISKSNAGNDKVDQVATAIRSITADSAKIKTLVDEVSLGSEEQSRGLDQIARAITQMEQVTQTTAANAEESAAAAEELNAQSEALREVVGRLNAMVGGQNDADPVSRPASIRSRAANTAKQPVRVAAAAASGGTRSKAPTEDKKNFPLETAFHEF